MSDYSSKNVGNKEGMDLASVWFATSDTVDSRNVEDEGSEQEKTNHITTSAITSAIAAPPAKSRPSGTQASSHIA